MDTIVVNFGLQWFRVMSDTKLFIILAIFLFSSVSIVSPTEFKEAAPGQVAATG